ncbi:hypothetical protein [Succiniclasticum ruminis]|uniref:Uncharacterized protein n=1 Tax=Succiniclasticum ruminis DSM 9236 TaxID=1123323 RepID=A0A1I2DM87_9FIRM|nr:hypothetical protein [Succiniclasticum ruminis]SFE81373.1 hypothetical protein SAMN05216245_12122 [Succiniclasticum ruminis DSM 9236]
MNINTLNILADAISDVGSWHWWYVKDDMVHIQFCDIQLYDESKPEKETHTTDVLAVRFYNHAFAVFLDNLAEDKWYERLRNDDSVIYPVDTYDLVFDDSKEAGLLLNDYKNRITVKDFNGSETLSTAKHLLCARCGEVGFIVGGDEIVVVGKKGKYTGEEIETASKKWWDYWKDYWKLRKTKEAYTEDYACEITIPVDKNDPKGNW